MKAQGETNPIWVGAYLELAFNADRLDAMIARQNADMVRAAGKPAWPSGPVEVVGAGENPDEGEISV